METYLARWGLSPDGEPIATAAARLLPVRRDGEPLMLKVASAPEEIAGARLMAWWDGDGAARVLEHEGDALLLERATGTRSLAEMARGGGDDEATRILCAAAARLHARANPPPPGLVPLDRWFRSLWPAEAHGGILARAAAVAREMLAAPRDVVVLHGDLHHHNVLDFGARGWLAIDPKGLMGERGFEFAVLFANPDPRMATSPGRLARQADVVAEAAGVERGRLLKWILAYAALSAAWSLEDGDDPALALSIAELVFAESAR